jgi:hypothetical protein
MQQKLHYLIEDTSRIQMACEAEVHQYYQNFLCFGIPLVHEGHLTEEGCDAAFWHGFNTDDHRALVP